MKSRDRISARGARAPRPEESMRHFSYERLSAQDFSFLVFENPSVHMHVAATQIFEAGALKTADGGIDIEAIKRFIESVLHRVPRYRQRLQWIPIENRPVWVDDHHFHLGYHIRHTSLPRPGGNEQLKRLSARIMAQQLDRNRPLWETWVVEGLQGDRFAVINKIHHCMIDGVSGVDLAQILLSPFPEYDIGDAPRYVARSAPTGWELFRSAMLERVTLPLQLINGVREFRRQTEDVGHDLLVRAQAIRELLGWAVRPTSDTPFNGHLGPHRRFDWLTLPLTSFKAVSKKLECSINDLVLATVTGAVREFLMYRHVHPDDIDFRIAAPVSVRREEERGRMGNRVSSWIVRLPIAEPEPLKRLQAIHEVTQELKASKQAVGVQMMMAIAEWTPGVLLSLGARAASGPINMIVTNVPGPQFPLYMLGAKLVELFPQVPLLENTGLGVALFSYDGKLAWGFNADYELLPDLRTFVKLIDASFRELATAAGVTVERAAREPGATEVVDLRPSRGAGQRKRRHASVPPDKSPSKPDGQATTG
jgi:diacylglycerol O-acyltransferase / wax synthase